MPKTENEVTTSEDVSLDQLFKQLDAEAKLVASTTSKNNLSAIDAELANLPKIESTLFHRPEEGRSDIVRINDPLTHIRKPTVDKDADAGALWFNMKKPEMTAELKRDLLVLKNRSALDRKRHYKKEKWQVPQFFQTGTIVEGNTEFYSARMAKKNRGRTLAEEILNDTDSGDYFKKKYTEIQKKKTSGGRKHYNKIKLKRRGY